MPISDGPPSKLVDFKTFFPRIAGKSDPRPLKAALIGTFSPRKCGIATFTTDIFAQLRQHQPQVDFQVFALDCKETANVYAPGVKRFDPADRAETVRTAHEINEGGFDAVWLQHEFGIYGGPDGEMVQDLVDHLAAPLIVTFHTVLRDPSPRQRAIVKHLISRATQMMVMSRHGRDLLISEYEAPRDRIAVIPHGAPDRPFGREREFKARLGLDQRPILMTFGLLGPGKGLEHMIAAMPQIVARHPGALYRIVGATHPNLIAEQGESYRESLQALATSLGVENNIAWDNRFLETSELLDQLEACDIYVTPYQNLQQSTSGTLSYAVALGKPVVATPYLHARELLANDIGMIVEPASSAALADAVNGLLDDPSRLDAYRRRAYEAGRETIWPRFAQASAHLLASAARRDAAPVPFEQVPGVAAVLAMSDHTGILQHSIGIVPDRRHGYCLDDNARALMLMNLAGGIGEAERMRLSSVYASFIQHAWNPDLNRFRNFMNFDRSWCEAVGSDDSNGRAVWSLGHTAENARDPHLRQWALNWFNQTVGIFGEIDSPRALAFAMLGAACVLRVEPGHVSARDLLARGGRILAALLNKVRRPDWAWFETVLSYDNPRLSQALVEAGDLLDQQQWIDAGLDTLVWIGSRQISVNGHFRPVGSEGFGTPGHSMPFDQQPLEALAAIEAAACAFRITRHRGWIEHARTVYGWYFGRNDRGAILADSRTGRCFDGVTPRGANENTGAESILAFQLAFWHLKLLGAEQITASNDGAHADLPIAAIVASSA